MALPGKLAAPPTIALYGIPLSTLSAKPRGVSNETDQGDRRGVNEPTTPQSVRAVGF